MLNIFSDTNILIRVLKNKYNLVNIKYFIYGEITNKKNYQENNIKQIK